MSNHSTSTLKYIEELKEEGIEVYYSGTFKSSLNEGKLKTILDAEEKGLVEEIEVTDVLHHRLVYVVRADEIYILSDTNIISRYNAGDVIKLNVDFLIY